MCPVFSLGAFFKVASLLRESICYVLWLSMVILVCWYAVGGHGMSFFIIKKFGFIILAIGL